MVRLTRGFVISLVAVGCGSAAPGSPGATDNDAAVDAEPEHSAADAATDRGGPTNRPVACGGDVASSGFAFDGPFSATYVYVQRCDGDCAGLSIIVADGATFASQTLTFVLRRGTTATYLGSQAVNVLVQRAGEPTWTTLSAAIDVTVAEPPGLPTSLNAPPFGMVVGTFTIQSGGVDVSGTFSSPVCQSRLAV